MVNYFYSLKAWNFRQSQQTMQQTTGKDGIYILRKTNLLFHPLFLGKSPNVLINSRPPGS